MPAKENKSSQALKTTIFKGMLVSIYIQLMEACSNPMFLK